ncbi:hypothetical protein RRG08_023115 [Elysia crispata]|uniref:Uncharacterized protein n=1 Tax=Elysia crispata TaxID=231223 RepID=A0AAE1ARX7_9GAST|nr:hypothetical protein RRG08_023115 [Elysia crispata]
MERTNPIPAPCVEVTRGSVSCLSLNLTADQRFSKKNVWLVWPGLRKWSSERRTLPEVKGMFEITLTHANAFKIFLLSIGTDFLRC